MSEGGFSYTEILISIFLYSILSFLLYSAVSTSFRGGEAGWEVIKETVLLSRLERELRTSVFQLSTPWWENSRSDAPKSDLIQILGQYDSFYLVEMNEGENHIEFHLKNRKGEDFLIDASYGSYYLRGDDE